MLRRRLRLLTATRSRSLFRLLNRPCEPNGPTVPTMRRHWSWGSMDGDFQGWRLLVEADHLPSGLVTFMFTDIEGSTRMARMLGADYREVLTEHRRLVRAALSAHGGAELFTEGDSFFVAFADASAAAAGGVAAQLSLAAHPWPGPDSTPRVRIGLHTGQATPHAGEYASPEVHRAYRIAAAAHGGQVLCSAATARYADPLPEGASLLDLGLHRLRGFDDRERLFQLVAPGLERGFPRPRTDDSPAHNLPTHSTSFIGRRTEKRDLRRLVESHRLVTVVGAGGTGKTRLAVELASDVVASYPDGVWFVDIASVSDSGLVAFAVAATLGLRPEPGRPMVDTLVDFASSRRLLILLDTCEAEPAACADVVSRMLTGGSGCRILATSRQPLGLSGEVVWRIPPLSAEPAFDGGPSDALALLVERTTDARGGRWAGTADAKDLSRVVARLDGLPLAIELAAARLRMLSPRQLMERLDDVLGALDAGRGEAGRSEATRRFATRRNATLQATVAWSYRTLGPRPARLLRLLSVFSGPVELSTVEWLLGTDALDPLAVLVDKSLILAEETPVATVYRMLEPIRAYAARELVAAGEERDVRNRHVDWCLHALHRAQHNRDGRPVTQSLYPLDRLADEIRAALRWTATGGSARQGIRLVRGLDQWWRERGLAREGRMWLFRLYGRIAESGEQVPQAELAEAYHMHSQHAAADGEIPEELRFAQRAETAAREAGDNSLLARVLAGRAASLLDLGELAEAERACREVIAWAYDSGVAGDALLAVYSLAELLSRNGALDEAAQLLAAARPVEAGRPAERARRSVDMLLGMVALARGDLVAAHDHLVVALRSQMAYGFYGRASDTLNAMAVRCARGSAEVTAARLFGAAQAARVEMRCASGLFADFWAREQAALREALGDSVFDAAYADGGDLSLADAAALALAVEHPDLAADSARFRSGSPSPDVVNAPAAADAGQDVVDHRDGS
jgi:predicted ATPase/class 3 adenylate cyclase